MEGRVSIRTKLILLLAVLCGTGGAVLRAYELAHVIDPVSAMMPAWHPVSVGLVALSAVFLAVSVWLAYTKKKRAPAKKPAGILWLAAELAAALALAVSAVLAIIGGPNATKTSRFVFGLLGVVSALCLGWIAFALFKRKLSASSGYGFIATVPVFWACFGLILDFWSHAGSATRTTYMYAMAALIFLTLALYGVAGLFFRSVRKRRVELYSLLGVYFSIVTLAGYLIARYIIAPEPAKLVDTVILDVSSMLRFGFAAVHLLCMYYAAGTDRFSFPRPAAAAAPPAGDAAELLQRTDRALSWSVEDEVDAELSDPDKSGESGDISADDGEKAT